jgi:hypothetical protein
MERQNSNSLSTRPVSFNTVEELEYVLHTRGLDLKAFVESMAENLNRIWENFDSKLERITAQGKTSIKQEL